MKHRLLRESIRQTCGPFLLFLISPFALAAQESDDFQYLENKDIAGRFVAEALRSNKALAAQNLRYQAAKSALPAASALPNPSLQITHFVESIQTRTGPQEQAIQLQQPLPWFGKRGRTRELAETKAMSLYQAHSFQQLTLAADVAAAVLDLAAIQKESELTRRNIALLDQLRTVVENRVRAGNNLTDLLKLQIEIDLLQNRLAHLEADRVSLNARIDHLLGKRPSAHPLAIDLSPPTVLQANPSAWETAALADSPQLAMMRSILQSEKARVALAKHTQRPNLNVGINYIRNGESPSPNTPDSGEDPWSIMVGMTLPIWNKGNQAVISEALLSRDAFQAEIEETELTILQKANTLIAKHSASEDTLERFRDDIIPNAEQVLQMTQTAYETGKASIVELIDSERDLLNLKTEYWSTAAAIWTLRWQLTALSGGLWLE